MHAMRFDSPGKPLVAANLPTPEPGPGQIRLRVRACGVCRTDLHVLDGDLADPKPAVIPGHEVVGIVDRTGPGAKRFALGQRVGVPWLGWTCGECPYCISDRENLCDRPKFTGYTLDGGYAEVPRRGRRLHCFALPDVLPGRRGGPASVCGTHRLSLVGPGRRGPPARPVRLRSGGSHRRPGRYPPRPASLRLHQSRRPRGAAIREVAGAVGAGPATRPGRAPKPLDAQRILFHPVGSLVPAAFGPSSRGVVVCGGIHMSDIPRLPYDLLWGERVVRSVANLTRRDGDEFLALAPKVPVRTAVETFPLARDGRPWADTPVRFGCQRFLLP